MKKPVYIALLCVFAVIFLISAGFLVKYLWEGYQNNQIYNQLPSYSRPSATQKPSSSGIPSSDPTGTTPSGSIPVDSIPTGNLPPVTAPLPTTTPAPTEPPAPVLLPGMQELLDMNSHTVGRITIPGCEGNTIYGPYKLDYPVVQTPNTPEWRDYYLYRDFTGKNNDHGTIYAKENCDIYGPSDNITLYGHNMNDHSMFGALWQYGAKSYYEDHKIIYFDTLYEYRTYEIFAVFRTSGSYGVGYPYHLFINAESEEEYDAHIAKCKELSLYDTGITPKYGDQLLTLSTCDFNYGADYNGRLVVVAVRTQ